MASHSTRRRVEAEHGHDFNNYHHDLRPELSLVSEAILVKWILDGHVVWWCATVLRIDGISPTNMESGVENVSGEILYDELGSYPPEKAIV